MLFIMFYIPFLFLWGFTLVDVITRKDLHAWSKLLWAIGILFIPLIGVFAYFITRPKDYDRGYASSDPYGAGAYPPSSDYTSYAGPTPAPRQVSDMDALASMHDQGVITDSEFESIRGRVAPAA
jgi:hypothetical protein